MTAVSHWVLSHHCRTCLQDIVERIGPPECLRCLQCCWEFADRTADVEQASRISAIKELFPDYGDGFLAACLSSYGQDPERVINALLEGSLSPQLSSLDPSMPLQAAPQAATNDNKGKGKARAAGAILLPIDWRPLC